MSGIFGVVSKKDCASDLLYGTDYHSHMGTEYGGMAVYGKKLHRHIHDISKSQFKSKFFEEYKEMEGNIGIGVISDRDPQPKSFSRLSAGISVVRKNRSNCQ